MLGSDERVEAGQQIVYWQQSAAGKWERKG
jgi:hypothetical protein